MFIKTQTLFSKTLTILNETQVAMHTYSRKKYHRMNEYVDIWKVR